MARLLGRCGRYRPSLGGIGFVNPEEVELDHLSRQLSRFDRSEVRRVTASPHRAETLHFGCILVEFDLVGVGELVGAKLLGR